MEDILGYTSLNRKRIESICSKVNSLRTKYYYFSDAKLSSMTDEFRKQLREGKSIDDIMCDALCVCIEAIRRTMNMVPYNTQIMAAASMSDNIIAEMKTGEGKTLVQILSSYLYALQATSDKDRTKWESVHILTANEYLAKRDKEANEKVFNLLGLTCSYAQEKSNSINANYRMNKVKAYNCDIVYATAKTVAFDYLDDNHVKDKNRKFINRKMYHAIVDEADQILLDEATTPLVLSGHIPGISPVDNDNLYKWATLFVEGKLSTRKKPVTCKVCEQFKKEKHSIYSEDAILFKDEMRLFLSDRLYKEIYGDMNNFTSLSIQEEAFRKEVAITNAILAKFYFQQGKEYILTDAGYTTDSNGNNIRIFDVSLINSQTGRVMKKTKYEDGIQNAIEERESYLSHGKYKIHKTSNSIDIAKITYPDFIRLYETGISGMTGTSDIDEFKDIYGLETYKVPTNKPSKRINMETEIYSTKHYKYLAIVKEVKKCIKTNRPVLVGTTSVNESDDICKYFDKYNIKYQRLDAKNDRDEASKIAKAGQLGMITVATNMAGRGTDIRLGKGVNELGGLYVIGVSKNNSRRIDNQLIGRCARQGDNGSSKYYQSLEDEIVLKRFGKGKLAFFQKFYENDSERITNKSVIKLVEESQIKEESIEKEIRKYKNEIEEKVFSVHKNKIYEQRNKILNANPKEFLHIIFDIIKSYGSYVCDNEQELYKIKHLIDISQCYDKDDNRFKENVIRDLAAKFQSSKGMNSTLNYIEDLRNKVLDIIDIYYINHIMVLEEMESSIINTANFGYDSIKKYERDANNLFIQMTSYIQNEIITYAIMPNLVLGMYDINNNEEMGADYSESRN